MQKRVHTYHTSYDICLGKAQTTNYSSTLTNVVIPRNNVYQDFCQTHNEPPIRIFLRHALHRLPRSTTQQVRGGNAPGFGGERCRRGAVQTQGPRDLGRDLADARVTERAKYSEGGATDTLVIPSRSLSTHDYTLASHRFLCYTIIVFHASRCRLLCCRTHNKLFASASS